MKQQAETEVASGLRRIEGQVRGIQRMLDERRYCIDVLGQMKAVRAALLRLEATVLRDHIGSCISEAFASGDADDRRIKIDELIVAVDRMTR